MSANRFCQTPCYLEVSGETRSGSGKLRFELQPRTHMQCYHLSGREDRHARTYIDFGSVRVSFGILTAEACAEIARVFGEVATKLGGEGDAP